MSLFKTGRKLNEKGNRKRTHAPSKSKNNAAKLAERDDETIDSDEELEKEARGHQGSRLQHVDTSLALETGQDKRIRLAKQYLRLHADEQKLADDDNEPDLQLRVAQSLKESFLSDTGRVHRPLADKYTGFLADQILPLRFKRQRLSPTCICLSADDAALYVGCKSGLIVRWDLSARKRTAVHCTENKIIRAITVSQDNRYLAVADGTEQIKVHNGTTLVQLNSLQGHSAPVTGLVFRQDTLELYSAGEDGTVKVWNLDEMAYIHTLFGHQSHVSGIDALSLGRIVTSGGMDKSLRVWKVAEETQLIYDLLKEDYSAVKFISNDLFVSGSIEGSVCLWSCRKKKPLRRIAVAHGQQDVGHPNWISAVAVLSNSDVVASGSCDGFVRIWKLTNNRRSIEPLMNIPVVGFVNAIEFTCDGRFLIVAVGQEHRLGRWWTLREARNRVLLIPLRTE
ncbi:U3 small nucleolar RNA-interacting protein 2 [Anopheles cruzii]|uniref:U3 small nucleolar RNA-interacting protein 2 n=1 Tax=Anopheles cruzii TaxID=68878 RepID=UPI0022EC427D|nr:U3 small nucleolar RNA-interacting protein 2 [Anopheles cruzii]